MSCLMLLVQASRYESRCELESVYPVLLFKHLKNCRTEFILANCI